MTRYRNTTSPSANTNSTSTSTPNIITQIKKSIGDSFSIDTIVSIIIGGAITAIVWFFINRYLNEKFPEKKK
ncbi:MAG: hypothetical protein OH335_04320 [Candidatus Parvarchaeota archaeon]|nr:hypothetical protein [Candidatus Jingweiarchaeum tengchongense]